MIAAILISLLSFSSPTGVEVLFVDANDSLIHALPDNSTSDACIKSAQELNAPIYAKGNLGNGDHYYICIPEAPKPPASDTDGHSTAPTTSAPKPAPQSYHPGLFNPIYRI